MLKNLMQLWVAASDIEIQWQSEFVTGISVPD
jgi:hypothetical protein